MKKKLRGQCPCGYVFDAFNDEKTAIVGVRLHFERFHQDFLPFGITDAEALALLRKGGVHGKQKVISSNFFSSQANPLYSSGNAVNSARKKRVLLNEL